MGAMLACGGGSSNSSGTQTPPGAISWQRVNTPFSDPNFIDFGSNGHWFAEDQLVVNPADGRLYATVWDDISGAGALCRTVNPVQ